ncbi:MAG: class I SAM-dependent methyltransferase [Chloroflexota bacterium]
MQPQVFRRLVTPPRRDQPELLDDPAGVLPDLRDNLADIRRLNRWLGGTNLAIRHLSSLVTRARPMSVLDVATGSADIPLAFARWSRERSIDVEIVGLDLYDEVLDEARRYVNGAPIRLLQGDARHLPFGPESFDVVTCCLALHHFAPREAERVLAEMWRVARTAIVVIDLTRGHAAHAGAWLATRSIARNRLTRHDGPLSVMRSYTPDEMARLAQHAGIGTGTVRRHLFSRQSLVALKGPSHAR